MTDQPQAPQVPGMQPDAPMPSAEQHSSTPAPAGQAAPEATQEVPSQQETGGLPDDAKERTRQEFEKLKTQLHEERSRREYAESVFNQFIPRQPVAEKPKPTPIVDPTTGLLNEGAFSEMQRQALQAQEKATKAEEQLRNYQITQEKKEAFTAHPDLDPNGKAFNKEIHIETRKILIDNMQHPEDYDGKSLSFKEAADLVKARLKPMIDKAQQQGAQQAIEKITPKEQASLEVTGTPTGKSELNTEEVEHLRFLTRRGKEGADEAIMQRLQGVPWDK